MKTKQNVNEPLPASDLFALADGVEITYLVTWPRGEPAREERTGVIEGRDGDYHLPMWAYGRADSYHPNGKYLVRCTSCQHHRIDSVHPDQILYANDPAQTTPNEDEN
jgi:hypothetical protein